MKKKLQITGVSIVVLLLIFMLLNGKLWFNKNELTIEYPFNRVLFPPEFPAPTFKWNDANEITSKWIVSLESQGEEVFITDTVDRSEWQPDEHVWEAMKSKSISKKIRFTVTQIHEVGEKQKEKDSQFINLFISDDSVSAPILYREIPLPFAYAEKYPEKMSFRLLNPGSVEPPHYAMKKFMVCGNCHSFSDDGKYIGLDFDAAKRDKGGYFINEISDTMVFDTSTYLSWNKLQDHPSFGMFSKLSPNGRYVITTIKDRVVSEDFGLSPSVIPFSQLFFPVNGILAVYDCKLDSLWELKGANSREFVQSNAFWSPNGETIVFVRAKALPYSYDSLEVKIRDQELIDEFVNRKKNFKYDIYTIPFNNGRGGVATPLKGASHNGMSNYFPTISPDGKWIAFCKAENYMLLQPDSKIYIVPFNGGKAKRLKSNLPSLNSWHSWSPNGKWLVYSSKGLSAFTDMFLTHIDEKGNASIPVLIEKSRVKGMAVNYPEFVNIPADSVFTLQYNYVTLDHITLARIDGDMKLALSLYDDYIKQDQYSLLSEYLYLAKFNLEIKRYDEALKFYRLIQEKYPDYKEADYFVKQFGGM